MVYPRNGQLLPFLVMQNFDVLRYVWNYMPSRDEVFPTVYFDGERGPKRIALSNEESLLDDVGGGYQSGSSFSDEAYNLKRLPYKLDMDTSVPPISLCRALRLRLASVA